MNSVLLMVDRCVPSDHSFLQGCLENYLGRKYELIWVGPKQKNIDNADRNICGLKSNGRMSLYFRFLIFSPKLVSIIKNKHIKIIFVRNDPIFAIFALIMRLLFSVKVMFQLSHLKEEQVLQRWKGHYNYNYGIRLFAKVSRCFRNYVISKADLFVPISNAMLGEFDNIVKSEVMVLGLGYDPNEFSRDFPRLYSFPYVIYVGTLDKIRDFEMTLDGFSKFLSNNQNSDLRLVVVGGNPDDPDRIRCSLYADKINLSDKVIFVNKIPRTEMIGLISHAVAGLSVIPPIGINVTISPTKLFEYIGTGIPIVVSRGVPAQYEVASSYDKCFWADNADEISKGIEFSLDATRQRDVSFVSETYADQDFSYSQMAQKIICYIDRYL